ncbi:MAG: efflux RND transporter periplasmic adaptor subunit [Cytophagia bacterium]|nr:MAG: efflux RND transporter periplasmic adaptor subunit [Cytophagia bacterium]TAG43086.1 MAG: efflux RND transporter periplasmic adaptor subunit [Cytophagia bacterium]
MLKYWKIILIFLVVGVLFYAIGATLNNNLATQKAQAQQAKISPKTAFQTLKLVKTSTNTPLHLVGVLKAYETLEFLSDTDGKITDVFFDLNQSIIAGQILAKTDTKLKEIQTNITELYHKKAKKDFERLEALHKNNNLSTADLENAKFQVETSAQNLSLNQQILEYATLKSPMNGIITQKMIAKGKVLQVGSPIAVIADISQLRLWINVAPQDLPKIKIGTLIPVKIPSQNIENINGIVKSISVQSNEAGSFPIEILIQNTNNLRAGIYAEAIFSENITRKTLLIPRIALVNESVFVLENDKAINKKITLGKTYNDLVEVISGLEEGENLIIKGQNVINDKL